MDLNESKQKYKDLKQKFLNLTTLNVDLEKELASSKDEIGSLLKTIEDMKTEETPMEESVISYSQTNVPCADLCKPCLRSH